MLRQMTSALQRSGGKIRLPLLSFTLLIVCLFVAQHHSPSDVIFGTSADSFVAATKAKSREAALLCCRCHCGPTCVADDNRVALAFEKRTGPIIGVSACLEWRSDPDRARTFLVGEQNGSPLDNTDCGARTCPSLACVRWWCNSLRSV